MSLEVILTSDRYEVDPVGRELLDTLSDASLSEALEGSVYYYDFPTYSDYETVTHTPSALLLSPSHGIIAIRAISQFEAASGNFGGIQDIEDGISQFCSILIGRFLKSRPLRKGVSQLRFEVTPVIYMPGGQAFVAQAEECEIITSQEGMGQFLRSNCGRADLTSAQVAEARSVIEGAKALVRPTRRIIEDPEIQKAAAALIRLESEIANFDEKQRRAALSTVAGPQRIRGLAGSGKTVIIAMKVAHLHLTQPKAKILVTFYTKSLNATIKSLITKFYRHYKDEDPDWSMVHIRHGWGGTSRPGVYADACYRAGISPLSLSDARQMARGGREPFDVACDHYLRSCTPDPFYDYFLIDEGQDFPSSFYRLAYAVTKGDRDKKSIVWAYDELQNILDVTIRSPEELFGSDEDGALVSLDRAAQNLPRGADNDIVLSKCYRNQREVLVVAHALGFGIYHEIVQMLESAEHWEDVGYRVVSGAPSEVGSRLVIERPVENSPLSLDAVTGFPLIDTYVADDFENECAWAVSQIAAFLTGGLSPHDVVVICLDDRNARHYFRELSKQFANAGLNSHNLSSDSYSDPPFFVEDRITLSTIYKAKGNEAPAIVIVGLDGAGRRTRSGRNKVFTALTRSKAWVRVSGMGSIASGLIEEIRLALNNFPNLVFEMPDLEKIDLIQRDISKKQARLKKIRDAYLKQLREQGVSEEEALDLLLEEQGGSTTSSR